MIGPDAPERIIHIKHKIINKISNFSLRWQYNLIIDMTFCSKRREFLFCGFCFCFLLFLHLLAVLFLMDVEIDLILFYFHYLFENLNETLLFIICLFFLLNSVIVRHRRTFDPYERVTGPKKLLYKIYNNLKHLLYLKIYFFFLIKLKISS